MEGRAGVTKSYGRNFLLSPEMVRSIVETITEAAARMGRRTTLIFSVYRENDSFYETESLDEVLKDANATGKAITNLEIRLLYEGGKITQSEDIVLALRFKRFGETKVTIILDSEEREWSFQLADRLHGQINRILRRPQLPLQRSGLIDWLAVAALTAVVLVAYNWITVPSADGPEALTKENLALLTLEEKLDTFIVGFSEGMAKRRRQYIYSWPLAIVFWGVVFAVIAARPVSRFLEKYSRSAYYWGDAIQAYDAARKLESRIVWSIAVALFVTIVGGLIVTSIT